MAEKKLSTYAISITPFDDNFAIDEVAFRAHLDRMAAAGIGVYVCGGGSGEAYTLSRDEQQLVLDIAVDQLKGKTEVRAMGTEPRTPAQMLDFAAMAKSAGFETIQIYSIDQGHGNQPTPKALEAYYRQVCESVDLNLVLSVHQSVGYYAASDLIADLIDDYPHIVGVNFTNPDITQLVRLLDKTEGKVEVHVGGPMQAIDAMVLGANGFLTSDANLAPNLCQSVVKHFSAGNYALAHAAFAKMLKLFTYQRALGGIVCTKAALNILGLPGGLPRMPRLPASEKDLLLIAEMLDDLDIRNVEGI